MSQFLRFGIVGGLCFVLTLATFSALHALGVHYVLAGVLGYAAGIALGFQLNRNWTFQAHHGSARHQAAKFLVVSAMGIALNALLLHLFVETAGWAEFPAEIVTVLCIAPVTFTINRMWAFR
jgi:putative flippase GtrA